MYREILVQATETETKVAVLEDGQLAEIYVEQSPDQRLVGNIYKGVVQNVLPGMQAAFVDIGLEKNAFLFVDDAVPYQKKDEASDLPEAEEAQEKVAPNIRDLVKEGQEIIVQVAKEPMGTKGARVTTQLSLPGRYLVLMPTVDYIGISRRIEDETERERLKTVLEEIKPPDVGLIVRTVAEGISAEDFQAELTSLLRMWERLQQKGKKSGAPRLLHRDLALVQRILRDVFSDDFQRLSVNSLTILEKVEDYLDIFDPHIKCKVFLSDTDDLFEKYAIDHEIAQALKRKVWLKSGGYLIFDETEALTVIDVNTGKFVGSTNLSDTILKTNIEAAREIARQIRLRNIGGIIIMDFIDMDTEEHQAEVLRVLEEELKKDKVRAHVLGITPLGLIEMTRKKVSRSLSRMMETTCPCCDGKGRIPLEKVEI
ncbi:MAG: Rne/Rng family ribonuclease [Peptococcia bacterium]